jgi:hypothetical protein
MVVQEEVEEEEKVNLQVQQEILKVVLELQAKDILAAELQHQ